MTKSSLQPVTFESLPLQALFTFAMDHQHPDYSDKPNVYVKLGEDEYRQVTEGNWSGQRFVRFSYCLQDCRVENRKVVPYSENQE